MAGERPEFPMKTKWTCGPEGLGWELSYLNWVDFNAFYFNGFKKEEGERKDRAII